MKKMLKRTSALLAAVMTVTSMGFTALADDAETSAAQYYSDSEVYYNDFSSGEVQGKYTDGGSGSDVYKELFTSSNIMARGLNLEGPKAEIRDGKLNIVSNSGYLKDTGNNITTMTYIKFDKMFDVSSAQNKKLIVSYDVALKDFTFDANNTDTQFEKYMFNGSLFKYDETQDLKETQIAMGNVTPTGNNANVGMAFQIPSKENNKATAAGIVVGTGNQFKVTDAVGAMSNGQGILRRPMGNVFHVEYEITPATETISDDTTTKTNAVVSKITMSDDTYTATYNSSNYYYTSNGVNKYPFELTDTDISGLAFRTYMGGTFEIDNIKAYYEGTLTAPTAVYNEENLNGQTVSSKGFTATVNFSQPISEAEAQTIKVDGANNVSATLSDDKKTATVTVSGLKKDGKYKLTVPATALNLAAEFTVKTENSTMWVQDFSDCLLKTTVDRPNAWTCTVDLDNDSVVNLKRRDYSTYAEIADSKLKIIGGELRTPSDDPQQSEYLSRTFVKFNKDYDVSSKTTDKLVVCYDVTIDKVNTETAINGTQIAGGLFDYTDLTTASTGIFHNALNAFGGGGNCGMAIQIPEGGNTVGLYMQNGNSMNEWPTGAYSKYAYGVFARPVGTTFHVKYEVTPATETEKAILSKMTISDGTYTVSKSTYDYTSEPDRYKVYQLADGKSKISGMRFDSWTGVDYSIDNISVGYEYAYDTPVVKYGETQLDKAVEVPVNTTSFTYTVDSRLEVTDVSGITLKDENGTGVNVTAAADGNNVTITLNETLASDTNYTLTLPNGAMGTISTVDKAEYSFKTKWEEKTFVKPEIFKNKEDLNVVFLGGSITNMNSYRPYVEEMLKEQYPNATMYNSGIGGTGSDYGFKRLQRDVINKGPDLVFIEFTVNDANAGEKSIKEMESIVRTLNSLEKRPAIAFITLCHQDVAKTDKSYAAHKAVADAYGIPVINVKGYVEAKRIADSEFKAAWDANESNYLTDGVHPGSSGAAAKLYGDYICNIISSNPDKYIKLSKTNAEVEKLSSDSKEAAESFILEALTLKKNTEGTAVSASAAYFAASEKPMRLILATYDGDGVMTGVSFSDLTKASTACAQTSINASVDINSGDTTVKAFIWDSESGMTPIAEAVTSLDLN